MATFRGAPPAVRVLSGSAGRAQILVIAVLMKGILKRSFNMFQWEALVLLVAGITVNQLNYCGKGKGGGSATRPPRRLRCCCCAITAQLVTGH